MKETSSKRAQIIPLKPHTVPNNEDVFEEYQRQKLLAELKDSLLLFACTTILHCSDLIGDFYQGIFLLTASEHWQFGAISLVIPFIPGIVAAVVITKSETLKEQLGGRWQYLFLSSKFKNIT